jgi:hypothetical protein
VVEVEVVDVVDVVVVGGIQAGPYSIMVNAAVPLIVAVSIHPKRLVANRRTE